MMAGWLVNMSLVESVGEIVGLLLIFVLILFATYLATKWIAKHSTGPNHRAGNVEIVETYKLGPGQYLQIVKVAGKYLLLAVTKDHISMLTELSEEQMIREEPGGMKAPSFQEVLKKLAGSKDKNDGNK